ncbi:MAG TPA: Ref family recombination enhancement nuclease [Stenotrophomonas sp.]|nr:Ref family recombination enhancement nuclease [Stenotrophomonas sp.]
MHSKNAKAMTAEEGQRIELAKVGPCMACLVLAMRGLLEHAAVVVGCDYNHCKSGNLRRGHAFGFALCVWHHRQHPMFNLSMGETREKYGPSLMDGSRLFHDIYGTDDELIAQQTAVIELRQAAA